MRGFFSRLVDIVVSRGKRRGGNLRNPAQIAGRRPLRLELLEDRHLLSMTGNVLLGNGAAASGDTIITVPDGGTISVQSGSAAISSNISLAGSAQIEISLGASLNISGVISESTPGAGSLDLDGGGELMLTNHNTYLGGTTVSGGELALAAPLDASGDGAALAPGSSLTISSGLVSLQSSHNAIWDWWATGTLTIDSGGTLSADSGGANEDTLGDLCMNGGATIQRTGTVANSGWGNFNVQGSITTSGDGNVISAPLCIDSSQLCFNVNAGTWDEPQLTVSGVIHDSPNGPGGVWVGGGGTVVLSKANTYSGGTTVSSGGVLQLGATDAIPSGVGAGDVDVDGILDLNGYSTGVNGLTSQTIGGLITSFGGPATLTVSESGQSSEYDGAIQSSGSGPLTLAKTGSGTLTLTGPSGFTFLAIDGGTLLLTDTALAPELSVTGSGAVGADGSYSLDVSTSDATAVNCVVDWGDGDPPTHGTAATGADFTPAYTYSIASPTTYAVTVTLTDGDGNTATAYLSAVVPGEDVWTGTDGSDWSTAGNWSSGKVPADGDEIVFPQTLAQNATPVTIDDLPTGSWFTSITFAGGNYSIAPLDNRNLELTGGITVAAGATENQLGVGVVLDDSQTVEVDEGGGLTVSGVLAGPGALTKTGQGTLTLANQNTYAGPTTVNQGDLALDAPLDASGDGAALAPGSDLTVSSGALVSLESSDNAIWDWWAVGTLTLDSGGTVSADGPGDNQHTLGPVVMNGDATISATKPTTSPWGDFVLDGPITASGTGNVILASVDSGTAAPWYTQDFDVEPDSDLTVSGVIHDSPNGSTAILKDGDGTMLLNAANTYSGDTTVLDGTLELGNPDAIPSGSAAGNVMVCGSLVPTWAEGASGSASVAGAGLVAVSDPTVCLLHDGKAVAGWQLPGGLELDGGGAWDSTTSPNGLDTYTLTGPAAIMEAPGAPSAAADPTWATAWPTIQGYCGAWPSVDGFTLTVSGVAHDLPSPGAASAAGSAADAEGATGSASAASADLTEGLDAGGILDLYGQSVTINGLSGAGMIFNSNLSSASTLTVCSGGSYAGTIQGGAALGVVALTVAGGSLNLSGANTWSGTTAIAAGATLQVGDGIATGSLGTGDVTDDGSLVFDCGGGAVVANTITGSGSLAQEGPDTLTLGADNSYGSTTISGYGTLQVGDGSDTGSLGGGGVTDNAALSFDRSDDVPVGNTISGTGSLVQGGSGTLTLTSNYNSYSGGTEIDSGNLAFGSLGAIGRGNVNGDITINDGGALDVPGPYPTVGDWLTSGAIDPSSDGALALTADNGETLTMTGYDLLSLGAAGNCQFTGTLSNPDNNTCIFGGGGGTLTVASRVTDASGPTSVVIEGDVNFAAANSYTGTTTIDAGTLQFCDGSTTPSFGAGAVTDNASLVFDCTADLSIANPIAGTGTLTQQGAGTTTLTGANSYAGWTLVSGGTLEIGDGGSLGTGYVSDNATLAFDCSAVVTVANSIDGTGSLVQQGAGTLTLMAANSYSGTTTISAGAIQVDDGGSTGSLGTGPVTDDTSLVFDRSDDVTVANGISGGGSLTQLGTGTLTLTGANGYGATFICAGTLQIGDGNSGSLGAGDVTVTDNGLLVLDCPGTGTVTVANTITGTGWLTQAVANTLILTGAAGFAGATNATDGELLTGALAGTMTVSGPATDDVGDQYTLDFSSSDPTLTGWQVAWGDGGTCSPGPTDTSATYRYENAGAVTVTATATDAAGATGTAKLAVTVVGTPPVFAINNGSPVSGPNEACWQTHVFLCTGTNLYGGCNSVQLAATSLNGPVSFAIPPTSANGQANDPPPCAQICWSGGYNGLFSYQLSSSDAWQTYDCFVTATDGTGPTDQYEIVVTTDICGLGLSMAAGSNWYSMIESTLACPESTAVQFSPYSGGGMEGFANLQVVIDQLPAEGTLFINGAPAAVGTSYPFSQLSATYQPSIGFCGLDKIRYHFTYQSTNQSTGCLTTVLTTNTATIAIQVGPLVRITGASIYQEVQGAGPIYAHQQYAAADTDSAVINVPAGGAGLAGGSVEAKFDVEANNPREDGIPTTLAYVITFSGIQVFNANTGQQYQSGQWVGVVVSGTDCNATSGGALPLLVQTIPGVYTGTLTVSRTAWSAEERLGSGTPIDCNGDCCNAGWYFGMSATANITVVSAALHGVDYHSNDADANFHPITHDPPPAGPPAPNGQYGPWEWLDNKDDGSVTDDPTDQDFPVCYTTSGSVNGDVVMETEVQIDVSAIPPDTTGIVVDGNGTIGNPSAGGVGIIMREIGEPTITPVNGKERIDVWLTADSDVPKTIMDSTVSISWELSFYGGAAPISVGTSTNRIYLTWRNPSPTAAPLYETYLYIGCDAASGLTSSSSEQQVVNAIWSSSFKGRSVHRVDGTLMTYTHVPGTALTAAEMLGSPSGDGQCTAWAQLLVGVVGAQGIGAHTRNIFPGLGYIRFRVRNMPAQGSGTGNYTYLTEFGFHQVVYINGFPDSIFDPSYGALVTESSMAAAQYEYELLYVTDLQQPNYQWVPDNNPPGIRFTP